MSPILRVLENNFGDVFSHIGKLFSEIIITTNVSFMRSSHTEKKIYNILHYIITIHDTNTDLNNVDWTNILNIEVVNTCNNHQFKLVFSYISDLDVHALKLSDMIKTFLYDLPRNQNGCETLEACTSELCYLDNNNEQHYFLHSYVFLHSRVTENTSLVQFILNRVFARGETLYEIDDDMINKISPAHEYDKIANILSYIKSVFSNQLDILDKLNHVHQKEIDNNIIYIDDNYNDCTIKLHNNDRTSCILLYLKKPNSDNDPNECDSDYDDTLADYRNKKTYEVSSIKKILHHKKLCFMNMINYDTFGDEVFILKYIGNDCVVIDTKKRCYNAVNWYDKSVILRFLKSIIDLIYSNA